MLIERPEGKWIQSFVDVFQLCKIQKEETVAILSESQSRPVLVELTDLALAQIGSRYFHVRIPSPPLQTSIPLRSTGTSLALNELHQVSNMLAQCDVIIDCTVEGLLHSPETPALRSGRGRIFMISNEHPEILERLQPNHELQRQCEKGARLITDASTMTVKSAAGTKLTIDLVGTNGRGSAGIADKPGTFGYWPAGLCLCYPKANTVNGVVVLDTGDVNLTFKRYIDAPVTLEIENDVVVSITGKGIDADLLRSYYASWSDPNAYTVSHVGWGMAAAARWDALAMYDKRDTNGTELRAFAGNFLFSTGANETAGRFTDCHFDFPMRHCSVQLDNTLVVDKGVLTDIFKT